MVCLITSLPGSIFLNDGFKYYVSIFFCCEKKNSVFFLLRNNKVADFPWRVGVVVLRYSFQCLTFLLSLFGAYFDVLEIIFDIFQKLTKDSRKLSKNVFSPYSVARTEIRSSEGTESTDSSTRIKLRSDIRLQN